MAHSAAAVDSPPPPRPPAHDSPSSYSARCASAGLQKTIISVFAGRCAALMDASRRSTRFCVSPASARAARFASSMSRADAPGSPPLRTG